MIDVDMISPSRFVDVAVHVLVGLIGHDVESLVTGALD